MAIDPIDLTRKLVNIESISYHEGPAGAFLAEFLAGAALCGGAHGRWRSRTCADSRSGRTGERFNVYAAMPGVTPDVVLSTHMDTVPPFFGCTEDDEFLYGRGTCDAKGIIAAQVAAAERLRDAGVKVGLLFVVGEERDSAGAKVANENPRGSRFLINGEPTDNRLALATKGALRVELRAQGRMAHSAYPELGESAIDKLVEALHDVLAMPLPVEPEIGPATLNIGLISGGHAPNVIADKAEAHLLVRTVGPSEEVKEEIERVVAGRAEVTFSLDLAVCAHAAGGEPADDDCEVCDGHSVADQLGRAVPAGAGIDPRGAHAGRADQQEGAAGVRGPVCGAGDEPGELVWCRNNQRLRAELNPMVGRWLCIAVLGGLVVSGAWGQENAPANGSDAKAAEVLLPGAAYDVAVFKLSDPNARWGGGGPRPDGTVIVQNQSLKNIICSAYSVSGQHLQCQDGPTWLQSDKYDIEAKPDSATAEQLLKLTSRDREPVQRRMQQALLADRLKLKVHFETRETTILALVVAKGGLKIHEAKAGDTYANGLKGPRRQTIWQSRSGHVRRRTDRRSRDDAREPREPFEHNRLHS